ncbi:kinase-like domain-containing protein [Russula ochroleuca]|uniref:non-specific serine/threonine protein kinase n=1 Tax=Russula ochroleuca TaxID=152965 RepID=A0A9P5JTC0_9AGAM|nr:kinase-like domain-containing protein [Russula ochroleuca]
MISIKDSSEPFRAFLGSILSIIEGEPVEPSQFDPSMQLDTIMEDTDDGPLPEDDIDDGSGVYVGSSSTSNPPMMTCSQAAHENINPGLMITSSSPDSPESFQLWVHLDALSNNTLALPMSDRNDLNGKQRLWLTRFVGSGSTGRVWQCHFDDSDDLFAVKIVELLCPSDADSRQRLQNEFNMYLALEAAYKSGQLCDRIAPHCYGAYEGDGVNIIILGLCDGVLNAWDELSAPEQAQVYKLVQDLHSIGILHGDLEPQNVMRAIGGGFHLIDFSQSTRHNCKENVVQNVTTPLIDQLHTPRPAAGRNDICSELQTLRNSLWN